MSWSEFHSISERSASAAEVLHREGRLDDAIRKYLDAAKAETRAVEFLAPEKHKTIGITVVSAVALWFKAGDYQNAEQLAHRWLGNGSLPPFAIDQLRTLLQTVWTTETADRAGIRFAAGDVLVSIKGGQVVYGGAPLDLISRKVDEVQAIFFRTAEMLLELPLRRRGGPSAQLQEVFQPWLFQVPAGSYQFVIRVQEPKQTEMFPDARPKVEQITNKFLDIVKASAQDPEEALLRVVPDRDYRSAFLKLTRSLAPTGKSFEHLEIRDASSPSARPIYYGVGVRAEINAAIRKEQPLTVTGTQEEKLELRGTLRGVHLDQDWIEVALNRGSDMHPKIYEIGEVLDDVIGPMVNRRVVVTAVKKPNGRLHFRDIEPEE